MRVFISRRFRRFMNESRLGTDAICKASYEIGAGLMHATLGGGVYKQRIARPGHGRSGGFRSIVFFRMAGYCYFILGFAKNDRDNLTSRELIALKEFAKEIFEYDDQALAEAIKKGAFEEIDCIPIP